MTPSLRRRIAKLAERGYSRHDIRAVLACSYADAVERCPMFLSGVPAAKAADWRAMREAWEAMVKAGTAIAHEAICRGQEHYIVPKHALASLEAALTKARA